MADTSAHPVTDQKTCFVVMGFGIKTDFATGRKLDLNKSYRLLIKPVVEAKGLKCVRADEIPNSGSIDLVMYQELLNADVVVADLSTANVNAFYELGIRHALRPRTTIVISEDKMAYPFDLNHIKISSYTHLGDAIDYDEVVRFQGVLGDTLTAVLNDQVPDSPVYTYLNALIPPSLREQTAKSTEQITDALQQGKQEQDAKESSQKPTNAIEDQTLALLTDQGEQAIKTKQYATAKALFISALQIGKNESDNRIVKNDSYLIQRLAFATYKGQQPDAVSALKEAMSLLGQLDLDHTNDPETVALAGAIEKRLYEEGSETDHLGNAILYFQRGNYLLHNRYNAINLAYLLNCRADSTLCTTDEDRIADLVYANRTRLDVLSLCERDWDEITSRENSPAKEAAIVNANLSDTQTDAENGQKFWILVNKAEAHFGLGQFEDFKKARADAELIQHEQWMAQSVDAQTDKLHKMLVKNGHLLNPAWVESE